MKIFYNFDRLWAEVELTPFDYILLKPEKIKIVV